MKKQFLAVNKNGFGSVYAIMLLQVVLVFVLLFFACTRSMLLAHNVERNYHRETLFVIYTVKEYLHQDPPIVDEVIEKEEVENEENEFVDEEKNYYFENEEIKIFYMAEQAEVTISNGVIFHINYNRENQSILDLVYS